MKVKSVSFKDKPIRYEIVGNKIYIAVNDVRLALGHKSFMEILRRVPQYKKNQWLTTLNTRYQPKAIEASVLIFLLKEAATRTTYQARLNYACMVKFLTQLTGLDENPLSIIEVEIPLIHINALVPAVWVQQIDSISQTTGLTANQIMSEAIKQYLVTHNSDIITAYNAITTEEEKLK
jgi:hypothetical protein